MARTTVSFGTFNLYNLNEPGLKIYSDEDGWSQEEYDKKIEWLGQTLKDMQADVWGVQELWHAKSLRAAFTKAGLSSKYKLLAPTGHSGQRIVCGGAVRKDILVGTPEWITNFPENSAWKAVATMRRPRVFR